MFVRMMGSFGNTVIYIVAMLLPSVVSAQAVLPEAPKRTAVVASGGKLMPGDQVRKYFLGNTVYFINLVSWRGNLKGGVGPVFSRDERHRTQMYQGSKTEVLWWLEGDAICNEMPDGRNRSCALIYEHAGNTFSCNRDEDICRGILRMVPGNVENH